MPQNARYEPSALGKRFGSDHGGERGALLYGLIGTYKLNGIDPEAYLRHMLEYGPVIKKIDKHRPGAHDLSGGYNRQRFEFPNFFDYFRPIHAP